MGLFFIFLWKQRKVFVQVAKLCALGNEGIWWFCCIQYNTAPYVQRDCIDRTAMS